MTDADDDVQPAVHDWPSQEERLAALGGGGGGGQGTGGGGEGGGGGGESGAKGVVTHAEQVSKYMEQIKAWLQQQPHHALPLVSFSALTCPPQVVRKVEEAADKYLAARHAHSSAASASAATPAAASVSASAPTSQPATAAAEAATAVATGPALPEIQVLASRLLTPVKPGVRSVLLGGGRGEGGVRGRLRLGTV